MTPHSRSMLMMCVAGLLAACGGDGDGEGLDAGDGPPTDAAPTDGAPGDMVVPPDAAPTDATRDAARPDAAPPDMGLPPDMGPPPEARERLVSALVGPEASPAALARACADIAGDPPPRAVADPVDETQARCLFALRVALGDGAFAVRTHRGVVRRLRLDLTLPGDLFPEGATRDDVARRVLANLGPVLGLEDPALVLRPIRRADGDRQPMFRQYVRDVPVAGAWYEVVVREVEGGFLLRSVGGKYVPDFALPEAPPVIAPPRALAVVAAAENGAVEGLVQLVPPALWVRDEALSAPTCPHCPEVASAPRLTWRIVYASQATEGIAADAWIDAYTGELLHRQVRGTDADLRVLTASGRSSITCYFWDVRRGIDPWFDEHGRCRSFVDPCWGGNHCWWGRLAWCAEPDAEGTEVGRVGDGATPPGFIRIVHRFFRDHFPSDADLGEDHPFVVYLDACRDGDPCPWVNASSVPCIGVRDVHLFGQDMATLDGMAHEAGHTYHRFWTDFVYQDQSGAIAEHISDAFGHFVTCDAGIDCDWQIGEDSAWGLGGVPVGCGRDMADPGRCGHPDHMSVFNNTTNDRGGVHSNCGILNKALHLMVEGGVHPRSGVRVTPIGPDKARVLYQATIFGLPSEPEFSDFRDRIEDMCDALRPRPFGLTADDCCHAANAFGAVGVGAVDTDCDGTPDDLDLDDDGDGVADGADNCPDVPNTAQDDFDLDGDGDACDDDADGDGVPNDADNCPLVPGPQDDRDGDGVGDVCEDWDGDGLLNGFDNCPEAHNRDQLDTDGDGLGDACEDDTDGDGVLDDGDGSGLAIDNRCTGGARHDCDDNCRFARNADQADRDGDSAGDVCDLCPDDPDTDDEDIDGDGLGDGCDPDRDGDGVLDADDRCPDEPGEPGMGICPPGEICRPGCPRRQIVVDPSMDARLTVTRLGPLQPTDPFAPVLTLPLDLCAFVDCEDQTVLADATLTLRLGLSAGLPEGLQMEVPLRVNLAVLDEAGQRRGTGEVRFISGPDAFVREAEVELRMGTAPGYTWRASGRFEAPVPASAAVPAYHLVLLPSPGAEGNIELLRRTPFRMTTGEPLPIEPPDGGVPDAGVPDAGVPDAGLDAGMPDAGAGDLAALIECSRLELQDFFTVFRGIQEVIAAVDDPQRPAPEDFAFDVDLIDGPATDTQVTGEIGVPPNVVVADGMQQGEVVTAPWTMSTQQRPSGAGGFSFPKIGPTTHRATIIQAITVDAEPTCGGLAIDNFGVHVDVQDIRAQSWFGSLGFTVTRANDTLSGLVVIDQDTGQGRVSGTWQGEAFAFVLDLETFELVGP